MKVLVTGASGFIGVHLVRQLVVDGHEVHALVRRSSKDRLPGNVRQHVLDIRDREAVFKALAESRPEYVVHLAAQSLPGRSWEAPAQTLEVNLIGTIHLVDAIRHHCAEARVLVVSSSSVYDSPPSGERLVEDALLKPGSPYAVSKLAEETMISLCAEHYSLNAIVVRPFFIIGPGKDGDVCSDFARRMMEASQAGKTDIPVGNLSVVRDFVDIRDCVNALVLVLTRGRTGEAYNIASGQGRTIRDVFDGMASLVGARFQPVPASEFIRPVDEPVKVGSPDKLMSLGWRPHVGFQESLSSILEFWRLQHDAGGGQQWMS